MKYIATLAALAVGAYVASRNGTVRQVTRDLFNEARDHLKRDPEPEPKPA